MDYSIYKLSFKTPVHFGGGRLSGSNNTFFADTLFSAFYKEAIKLFGEDNAKDLYYSAQNNALLLSDAMPYCDDTLFIPKPIIAIKSEKQGDSSLKKKFKKLKYIPIEDIDAYMSGNYNPSEALELLNEIGKKDNRSYVLVNDNKDNEPYNVGIYNFEKNKGLYFIVGAETEAIKNMVEDIMYSLSYTGIGGKISAGLGKFDYEYIDENSLLTSKLKARGSLYTSLSISMAKEKEIEKVVEGASYELIKRSGFIASEKAFDTPIKKRDFYCFKGGSCFNSKFEGDVFNVSSSSSKHEVYRYAKPMLLSLK